MHWTSENIPISNSPLKDTPFSCDHRERIIHDQRNKLIEMRRDQMNFFDLKMAELNEKEGDINSRFSELRERENWVKNQLMRIEVEKAEISSIRDLLKAESAAMQLTVSDMNSQIQKYDRLLRVRLTEGTTVRKPQAQ